MVEGGLAVRGGRRGPHDQPGEVHLARPGRARRGTSAGTSRARATRRGRARSRAARCRRRRAAIPARGSANCRTSSANPRSPSSDPYAGHAAGSSPASSSRTRVNWSAALTGRPAAPRSRAGRTARRAHGTRALDRDDGQPGKRDVEPLEQRRSGLVPGAPANPTTRATRSGSAPSASRRAKRHAGPRLAGAEPTVREEGAGRMVEDPLLSGIGDEGGHRRPRVPGADRSGWMRRSRCAFGLTATRGVAVRARPRDRPDELAVAEHERGSLGPQTRRDGIEPLLRRGGDDVGSGIVASRAGRRGSRAPSSRDDENEIMPITRPSSTTGKASSSCPRRKRSRVSDSERSAGTEGGGRLHDVGDGRRS